MTDEEAREIAEFEATEQFGTRPEETSHGS